MDRAEYRPDLTKRPGTYFVIADDEEGQRRVLEVQRASDHPVEEHTQHEDLQAVCDTAQSPLLFLTYTAVSHTHAAHRTYRAYADQQAFQALEDVFHAAELAFTGAGFTDDPS